MWDKVTRCRAFPPQLGTWWQEDDAGLCACAGAEHTAAGAGRRVKFVGTTGARGPKGATPTEEGLDPDRGRGRPGAPVEQGSGNPKNSKSLQQTPGSVKAVRPSAHLGRGASCA